MEQKQRVVIGMDPHKLSVTIEVVDRGGAVLGKGRYETHKAGFAALVRYVKRIEGSREDRLWAVEGANGAGRATAQRLLAAGENVVDVPAKLAARARVLNTGHNRKTDAVDAHSIAMVAISNEPGADQLRGLVKDGELESIRMLADRYTSSPNAGSRP